MANLNTFREILEGSKTLNKPTKVTFRIFFPEDEDDDVWVKTVKIKDFNEFKKAHKEAVKNLKKYSRADIEVFADTDDMDDQITTEEWGDDLYPL